MVHGAGNLGVPNAARCNDAAPRWSKLSGSGIATAAGPTGKCFDFDLPKHSAQNPRIPNGRQSPERYQSARNKHFSNIFRRSPALLYKSRTFLAYKAHASDGLVSPPSLRLATARGVGGRTDRRESAAARTSLARVREI